MQMVAYHTLIMVHKVIQTGKPEYIANKLEDLNWKEELGEELLSESFNITLRLKAGFISFPFIDIVLHWLFPSGIVNGP